MKTALTIAGSDSGGGAGIQADLKTFAAFGVYGSTAVTAITAQNTCAVGTIHPVPPELVRDQIDAVLSDIGADALKTGMLFSGEIILAVTEALEPYAPAHLVVDPVMVAKNGAVLLQADARRVLIEKLFPLCEVLMPNLPEAEMLLGRAVKDPSAMRDAAAALCGLGPRAVILKGGHLEGDILDLLFDGDRFLELRGPRIATRHTHGTGCTLSAAVAACLARGAAVADAFSSARDYVARAIGAAPGFGSGAGPLHHGVKPPPPYDEVTTS